MRVATNRQMRYFKEYSKQIGAKTIQNEGQSNQSNQN